MFDQTLVIEEPSEPSDVYWYNMKITDKQRRKSIIYSYILLVLCLGVSFACLFGLQLYQIKHTTPPPPPTQDPSASLLKSFLNKDVILNYAFTIGMAVLIALINKILGVVVEILTESERHETKTHHNFSLIIKTTIVQFLNSAVIYFIICTAANLDPVSPNGIVNKVTSLVTITGIVSILMNAVQLGPFFSEIIHKCKYSDKSDEKIPKFQIELNKEIEKFEFGYSTRYAFYLTHVWIVSFYSYIAPYAVLIQAALFFVDYWVDKFNLFRRCSSPTDFGFKLTKLNIKILECSLIMFAVGNFIFGFMIHGADRNKSFVSINAISLGIAVVYCIVTIFLPSKWLYGSV